jgi:hypothetical protein
MSAPVRTPSGRALVAALLLLLGGRAAAGQQQGGVRPDDPQSSRGRLAVTGCAGQPISAIVVITAPPFRDRLPRQLEWVRTTVRAAHQNTRARVIRRFLLLKEGDPCNQIRRAESERLLRAQPYLVEARIYVYDDEQGGVRLEVETRDEFSLVAALAVRGTAPVMRAVRVGDANLFGEGMRGALLWRHGGAYRDVLGVDFTDYQFGGSRNELRLMARRLERGQVVRGEVIRPFYTDLQRVAWVASGGGVQEYAQFFRPGQPLLAVDTRRGYGNVGALTRIGPVGRLRLVGASLSHERERFGRAGLQLTPTWLVPDTLGAVIPRYRDQDVVRLNALLGVRALRFVPVQGFDALTGTQDVRVGVQLGLMAGQSLPVPGSADRDQFLSGTLYAGVGGGKSFLAVQANGEGRYDRVARAWDNVVGSGRAAWYFRPAVKQTTVLQAEWGGGWQVRVPFQLSLADRDGGLLGHQRSELPGARRVVLRGEQRLVIPTRFNVADVGLAVFAEGGRLWGDPLVPYSADTPWRGAAGVSVLAAVPPRSRRLWRMDVAVPLGGDPRGQLQLRFTNLDRSRVFWQDPLDVRLARERTAPASLFQWP